MRSHNGAKSTNQIKKPGGIQMNLNQIAREIVDYDFTGVDVDDTSEACFNLATDLYNCSEEEANIVVEIIMDEYVHLIK